MNGIILGVLSLLLSLWISVMVIKFQEYAQKGLNWQIGFWVVFWLSIYLWTWL